MAHHNDVAFSPKKVKIALFLITGAVTLYALLGFFLIPYIMSQQLPKIIEEKMNRPASVEDIQFNPFSLELELSGLQIADKDSNPFFSFEKFYVNIAFFDSIRQQAIKLDQLLIKKPFILISRNQKGRFNYQDLLSQEPKPSSEKEESDLFPFIIASITLAEGHLSWIDYVQTPFQQEDIVPIDLQLNDFSTLIDSRSQLGFTLNFASGGHMQWNGQFGIRPLYSSGSINIKQASLVRIWELFLHHFVNFRLLQGRKDLALDYLLVDTEKGLQLQVTNGELQLTKVQIGAKKQKETVIDVPDFHISGIAFDLMNQQLTIGKVSSKSATFKTWLTTDKSFNLSALFSSPASSSAHPASASAPPVEPTTQPWSWQLKNMELNNYTVHFQDKSLPSPAPIELSKLSLTANDLNSTAKAVLPVDVQFDLNRSGHIKVATKTVLKPLSSHIELSSHDIALKNFQSYLDQFVNLEIDNGQLGTELQIILDQATHSETDAINVKAKGDINIDALMTKDTLTHNNLLGWKSLKIHNLDVDTSAQNYLIDTISLDKPYAKITIHKDKSINVSQVGKTTAKQPSSATDDNVGPPAQKAPLAFTIHKVQIKEGASDFADLSLILPFSAHITQLGGSIENIASNENAVAKIDLKGSVAELSPVIIDGRINPHRGDSDVLLDFKSLPLPLITPYMAEFAGRKIEKGNMSLALRYHIENKQLTASNKLLIDQLVLGEKVENPKAASLPLDLAIALLEDSQGKINLDVPISGSLEDPQFSLGGIIVDALINVISKIVTSPFTAIASLIDTEEDISQIEFSPGLKELTPTQTDKLNALASALQKRPGLMLEIKGRSFSQQDWPALQKEALDKHLLQIHVDNLSVKTGKPVYADKITLTPDEYNELLADLFIKKFPEFAERSFFGTPQLKAPLVGDFYQTAIAKLSASISPDLERLNQLAKQRAQQIAKHLVEQGIAIDRIFLLDVEVDPDGDDVTLTTLLNLTTGS